MIWRLILGGLLTTQRFLRRGGLWKPILALLATLGLYAKGRADQRKAEKLHEMEDYHDTRRKMDAVDRPADADDARRRMRERQPGGDL